MPGRRGPSYAAIVAALAVLGAAAPAWSACPAGMPAGSAFHLPVEKLAPVAARLAHLMARKTIQGRAPNGVETRQLADVQADPGVKYTFRAYAPLGAIPARVQSAFVAAGEMPTRAEIESVKRRKVDCLETAVLEFMSKRLVLMIEAMKEKREVPVDTSPMLVPYPVLRTVRGFVHEFLPPEERDVVFERNLKRRGNEEIIAYLIIKSDEVAVDRLLELSLNMHYFGLGSFGIAAAAMNYFGKPVDRLSLAEAAYLAGLPKGPNNYHPVRWADKAVERRNWVIGQMQAKGFLSEAEAKSAKAEPLNVKRK
jgi:hypothetical protein